MGLRWFHTFAVVRSTSSVVISINVCNGRNQSYDVRHVVSTISCTLSYLMDDFTGRILENVFLNIEANEAF